MANTARVLRLAAFSVAIVSSGLVLLFMLAEVLTDPGGGRAAELVIAWMIPLVVLTLVAVLWPEGGEWLLLAVVMVLGGFWVWVALDASWWSAYLDAHGPVLATASFMLVIPVACVGLRKPGWGGGLMLAIALFPAVAGGIATMISVGSDSPLGPIIGLTVLTTPATVIIALAFIASALLDHRNNVPRNIDLRDRTMSSTR